jgi:hypothetical protein
LLTMMHGSFWEMMVGRGRIYYHILKRQSDQKFEAAVHGFSGPVQSSYPVFQFPCISKNRPFGTLVTCITEILTVI